ncbi:unnamed protein product [Oikopleura dioica]|uniref:RNA transcription, translation and transport factor protein n=1 Tax=Oikopleura dioica TaxID=34765 RepID=E4XTK0_OIKDI|nr:unnamed protein product [Oikopleura dioica]
MFRRKLYALGHPNPEENYQEESRQKSLVIWLEGQFINAYKPEDRGCLKETESADWNDNFNNYLVHVECPHTNNLKYQIEWLLAKAIQSKYQEDENYAKYSPGQEKKAEVPHEFREGLAQIAKKLQVQVYQDDLVVSLEACKLVVEALVTSRDDLQKLRDKMLPKEKIPLGFDLGDKALNEAALVLRLLHIEQLRKLQNDANRALVQIQKITANPLTDTNLGQVGRG